MSLFPLGELSHFSTPMYRQWVPCECNSSYNFTPNFFKLCTCFLHSLKMCMWFGYNPCINFYHFFQLCGRSHFSTPMYRQWVPCEYNSSYNFTPIFFKLCKCFLHSLKMCMWFGYNSCINTCYFFHVVNFVIFWHQILWKCIDSLVPCERNSSYSFRSIFFTLCTCFLHSLKMCMSFGYKPWIIFCHFFYFVNFVIFWPQIVWKCIDSGCLVSATPYTISYLSLCNFAHLFFHGLKITGCY